MGRRFPDLEKALKCGEHSLFNRDGYPTMRRSSPAATVCFTTILAASLFGASSGADLACGAPLPKRSPPSGAPMNAKGCGFRDADSEQLDRLVQAKDCTVNLSSSDVRILLTRPDCKKEMQESQFIEQYRIGDRALLIWPERERRGLLLRPNMFLAVPIEPGEDYWSQRLVHASETISRDAPFAEGCAFRDATPKELTALVANPDWLVWLSANDVKSLLAHPECKKEEPMAGVPSGALSYRIGETRLLVWPKHRGRGLLVPKRFHARRVSDPDDRFCFRRVMHITELPPE